MSNFRVVKPLNVAEGALTSNVAELPPAAYNAVATYALGDTAAIFSGPSNTLGKIYESLAAANTGNAPASSPLWWREIGTAYLAYSGAASYALGAVVTDTTGHRLYESLAAANSGNPLTDATKWLDIGPTIRWAMLDTLISTQTKRYGSIAVEIQVTGRVDTLALLNIAANSVNVTMELGGEEIYNQDHSLLSYAGIRDYWDFHFGPRDRKDTLVLTGLPIFSNPKLVITLTDVADVSIGHTVFGQSRKVGGVQFGAGLGGTDFSRFEEDGFGGRKITERSYRDNGKFTVWVAKAYVDPMKRLLKGFRAQPALIIGSDLYDSAVFFGLIRDHRVDITHATESQFTIEVENY